MAAGHFSDRDFGEDHGVYSPYHPDAGDPPHRGAEPGHPQPGYPGYSEPQYPEPQYPEPQYPAQPYPASGYPQPGYYQSGYEQPGYGRPGYGQPGYYQDGAGYPAIDQPTATFATVAPPAPAGGPVPPASPPPAGRPLTDPWDPYRSGNGHSAAGTVTNGRPVAAGRDGTVRAGAGLVEEDQPRRKRRGLPVWQELPLLLIIAFCLAILVRTFLVQAFYIPSGSMEDTLLAGDRVLVNKVVYNFREPARGEVVVFKGTDAWAPANTDEGDIGTLARFGRTVGDLVGISRPGEKDFIKRVIGLPGDTVSCCDVDGRVFVNGQPLAEDYVIRDSPLDDGSPDAQDCRSRRFDEVIVQPGHMFVMGDHRQVSQDSRCQGQVPIDNIIGRAFVIVWPNSRWNSLSQPDTFDGVPPPATTAAPAGPLVPAEPAAPAQLAVILPILFSFGWTFRHDSARSRLNGRGIGRRLAG